MAISQSTLKILWAKSGGLCAFPGCDHELISKTSEDIIGHVCHIVAQSAAGPRGNPNISQSEIDCEQNLILLCPTHHRIVDTDEITYTIEKLTEIKAAHEQYIYEKIHCGSKWNLNFSQLYYINLPRISIMAAFNGIVMNFDFMERFQCLHKIGFQLNSIMIQVKDILQNMTINTISLPSDLSKVDIGQNIEFTETFRTKNMPAPNVVCNGGYDLTGSLNHDPYIYLYKNGKKLLLTLDPTWMTTATSFVNFSSGRVAVSGVATVKQIEDCAIIATPYFLGIPKTPWDDLWNNPNPPRSINIP